MKNKDIKPSITQLNCQKAPITWVANRCKKNKDIKKFQIKKNDKVINLLIETKEGAKFIFNGNKIILEEVPQSKENKESLFLTIDGLGIKGIETDIQNLNNEINNETEEALANYRKIANITGQLDMFF